MWYLGWESLLLLYCRRLEVAATVMVKTVTDKTTLSSSPELISAVFFLPRTRLSLSVMSSKFGNGERLFFISSNYATTPARYLKFFSIKIGNRQNGWFSTELTAIVVTRQKTHTKFCWEQFSQKYKKTANFYILHILHVTTKFET